MTWTRAILVCSLIAAATPAHAQPAKAQAEVLYNDGRTLMTAGKIAEACAAFEQSHKLDPAVTTLIAHATCREKLGQLATAWGLFLDAERQTRSASNDTAAQLHQIALDRAAKLEPRVSKLTISVPDKSKIDRLEILRDTELVPAVMWNRALPVDGGTYTITARTPGATEWSTRVTLASQADTKTVDIPDLRNLKKDLDDPKTPVVTGPLTTPAPAPSPTGAQQPSSPPKTPDAPGRRSSVLPIAVGAGAVVLLGGGLGFSLWGDSTYDKAKAELADQARRDSLYDSANLKRYTAEVLAVAGIGCAGVAVWLYLRQRGTRAEPTSARAGHLMLAPTASGIGVAGRTVLAPRELERPSSLVARAGCASSLVDGCRARSRARGSRRRARQTRSHTGIVAEEICGREGVAEHRAPKAKLVGFRRHAGALHGRQRRSRCPGSAVAFRTTSQPRRVPRPPHRRGAAT